MQSGGGGGQQRLKTPPHWGYSTKEFLKNRVCLSIFLCLILVSLSERAPLGWDGGGMGWLTEARELPYSQAKRSSSTPTFLISARLLGFAFFRELVVLRYI